jgi:glucose-6-phosphate isomerase
VAQTQGAVVDRLVHESESCGITLDCPDFTGLPDEAPIRIERAFDAMRSLEAGAVANPSEGRRVGHFWLRAPELAPEPALATEIRTELRAITSFAAALDPAIDTLLLCGIGGSALGPELLVDALGAGRRLRVMDNVDPAGIARILGEVEPARTQVIVASKSGGTRETLVGLELVTRRFADAGVPLAPRAAAITLPGSLLDRHAIAERWGARFRLWDWVGGRFSVTSAVGVLPAALCGVDTQAFLAGAARMDAETRATSPRQNPAALLALAWHQGLAVGRRAMAVIPYADRLVLLPRYLQQLLMESLGKAGQGLVVFGNKGSTDQHALMQQLYEGPADALVLLLDLRSPAGPDPELEPGVRVSDHLAALHGGTRAALLGCGRPLITLTLERLEAAALGALVALFERAVGLYASMLDLNAYDQPSVELGKRAAERILALHNGLWEALAAGVEDTAPGFAARLRADPEETFQVLRRLTAQGRVARARRAGQDYFSTSDSITRTTSATKSTP